jgi:hypothetical protein
LGWLRGLRGREPPLLDTDYLGRLRQHLGAGVVAELMADGRLELMDRTGQLSRLAAAGDAQGLRRVSHDLIAVAGHLGLSALSLAAVALNRSLEGGSAADLAELSAPVVALAERSLAALEELEAEDG